MARASDDAERFERALRLAAGSVVLAFLLLDLWSAFALRGLVADGAGYFAQILGRGEFALVEPARLTVQILQQFPSVLALRLNLFDLNGLMVLFGATLLLLPLLFLVLCYLAVPKGAKALFLLPLAHFLMGSQATALIAIAEGPVASGYFWLVLFLVLFRTDRYVGQVAVLLAALPVLYLHEGMVFLGPVLAMAAFSRARRGRPLVWLLVPWFLIVTATDASFILDPRDPVQRAAFAASMLNVKFFWLWGLNGPALLGLLAATLATIVVVSERRWPEGAARRPVGYAIACFAGLGLALDLGTVFIRFLFDPYSQFAARSYGLLLSLPLAILLLHALRRPAVRRVWERPAVVWVVAALALGQLGWQTVATVFWSDYVAAVETVLADHRGLVSWPEALASLPPEKALALERMNWGWTNPTLSLLLAPQRRVTAVIASRDPALWQPFDPANPDELPDLRFIDTSAYREAMLEAARP